MFQLTIWSLPSLIALILASHTFRVVRRSPNVPGVTALLGLSICVIVWSAGQLFGTLTMT